MITDLLLSKQIYAMVFLTREKQDRQTALRPAQLYLHESSRLQRRTVRARSPCPPALVWSAEEDLAPIAILHIGAFLLSLLEKVCFQFQVGLPYTATYPTIRVQRRRREGSMGWPSLVLSNGQS